MTDVTCALIRNEDGLVLAMRRGQGMSNAGKWEFPGGKTREGEHHEDCIIREIDEELGISIIITGTLEPVEHDYGDREIRLIPFLCETLASKPELREHDDYRWIKPEELATLDMKAAMSLSPGSMPHTTGQMTGMYPERTRLLSSMSRVMSWQGC
jgi:8-oxo-dGTP diphosphatase